MTGSDVPIRIVVSTAANPGQARRLAWALVEERLAACVTFLAGAESIYRWNEQIETAEEVVLLIKTADRKLDALEKRLKELHSYETPEFLVLNAEGGSAEYLAWIESAIRQPPGEI